MAVQLEKVEKENAELKRKLNICNYPTQQGGSCGNCDEYKHLPWKDDEYGYICATCLHELTKLRVTRSNEKLLKEILSILQNDEPRGKAIEKLLEGIDEFGFDEDGDLGI